MRSSLYSLSLPLFVYGTFHWHCTYKCIVLRPIYYIVSFEKHNEGYNSLSCDFAGVGFLSVDLRPGVQLPLFLQVIMEKVL